MLEATEWPESNFDFKLPDHLTEEQKEEFGEFLYQNRDSFATSISLSSLQRQRSLSINIRIESPGRKEKLLNKKSKKC